MPGYALLLSVGWAGRTLASSLLLLLLLLLLQALVGVKLYRRHKERQALGVELQERERRERLAAAAREVIGGGSALSGCLQRP